MGVYFYLKKRYTASVDFLYYNTENLKRKGNKRKCQKSSTPKLITERAGGKSVSRSFVFFTETELPAANLPPDDGKKVSAEPAASGQVFGLIEIEAAPNKKTSAFLDALIQEINTAATSSFGRTEEKTPEELFENFIQKTNYRYLELIGKKSSSFSEDWSDGLPKINAALAFINDRNLSLATRGKMLPFLIYQIKPGNFRIMNIAESAAGKEGRTSKLSLFTNIVNGKIGSNDYLFFTTESILDYFSLEKISKTVSAQNPEAAALTLKNFLGETANPETSFAFLIVKIKKELPVIKAVPVSLPPAETNRASVPQNSMEGLLKTAADTEKMLTPSLGLNIGGKLSSFLGGFKNIFKKNEVKNGAKIEYYSSQFRQPTRANKSLRSASLWFLAILRIPYFLIKVIFSFLFNVLKISFYSITNWRGGREKVWADAADNLKKARNSFWSKIIKLPRLSKALLVFVIFFIILFAGSTALLYQKYQNDLAAKNLEQMTEAIQNQKSSIDASLIYNDETGAIKALTEADVLLAKFPQKTKAEKNAYQNIANELEVLREKLMHVVNITDPTVVANFTDHNPNAKVEKFIVVNGNIYAFDDTASAVYKINLKNNAVADQSVSGLNFDFVSSLENNNSAILYRANDKKFFSLDLKNDILKELGVSLNENETQVDGLAVYNQKLYVLDSKDNQIFKQRGRSKRLRSRHALVCGRCQHGKRRKCGHRRIYLRWHL